MALVTPNVIFKPLVLLRLIEIMLILFNIYEKNAASLSRINIFLHLPKRKAVIFIKSNIIEIMKIITKFTGNMSLSPTPFLSGRKIALMKKYIIIRIANIVFVIFGM